ncbi:family 4 glycosyl hydrolase [Algisphaera agarilytica]|uniref:Alpha-galactosidase n=1 Tax=Algisphaera agarilytica TaxID=1385975 RepID=A0A7X0LIW1_9BACT|nr:glycoside hydrolase family 4 [Algisphaera agarilytica]MBB6428207.1 alpha-galactosidase [Algisphaera agarilytica]
MAHSPKVVILGAGSLFFGRKAVWQMIHSPHLRTGTLALVDTDADRLAKMKTLAEKAIAHNDAPLKLEASTDRREVLKDADFVVFSFADRNAHFRGVDCDTSVKYGIRMCSGDTIGPGGVFRTLREWPEIAGSARDVLELCPDAWVINYINPAAVHGMGLARFFPDLKSMALCDAQFTLHENYAKAAGVPFDDKLKLRSGGPNHFTWLLEASYDGKDILPDIVDHVRKNADDDLNQQAQGYATQAKGWLNNGIAVELHDAFGYLPAVIAHTKEYVRFYQRPGTVGRDTHPPLKIFEVPDRLKWTDEVWQRVDDYVSGSVDIAEFDTEFGPDPATDLIENMWAGLGKSMHINTANGGAVPNMADDAFLELLCEVDMDGPRPLPYPEMPRGIRGLCEQVLDTHELTAAAAFHTDRDLLRRALLTDPLTYSVGDTDALIDELLELQRDAVSSDWFD